MRNSSENTKKRSTNSPDALVDKVSLHRAWFLQILVQSQCTQSDRVENPKIFISL